MALYHSARGSVNYTIVGSPTIVDGVASGFSKDDYLKTSSTIQIDDPKKLELQAKFTVTDNATEQQILCYETKIASDASSSSPQGISGIIIRSNGTISWKVGRYYGSTTDFNVISSATVNVNDNIIAKCYYIAAEDAYCIAVSKDNGATWTKNTSASSLSRPLQIYTGTLIGIGNQAVGSSYNKPFSGSIDLKQTYIKIDGAAWFGVCPVEVTKVQLRGPVDYSVVGSPTIIDGVASGFSYQNYLNTSEPFSPTTSDSFEIVLDINTKDVSGDQTIFLSRHGSVGSQRFGLRLGHSSTGSLRTFFVNPGIEDNWNTFMRSTTTVLPDTDYKLKVTYENMVMKLYVDTGSGFVEENSLSNITPMSFYKTMIGTTDYTSGFHFKGSIDLNETYIKVNGKLWFWRPRETEKVIVNGVEVWTKAPVVDTSVYTVGSPTITSGVATGLSSSNYIVTGQSVDFSKPFELVLDFTLNSTEFAGNNERLFIASGNDTFLGYVMRSNKKLEIGLPTGGWLYTSSLTLGGSYKVKYEYDGTAITGYLDSGSGYSAFGTATTDWDTKAPLQITGGTWGGSVNLNNSYIITEGVKIELANIVAS